MTNANSAGVSSPDAVPPSTATPIFGTPLPLARWQGVVLERSRTVALALVVGVGLWVRLVGLGASGFSEDEMNKLRAVRAYNQFDFTENAEHPFLMKGAIWVSVGMADWWNRHEWAAAIGTIAPEAALRLPNAVLGALSALVLFLLAEALFDTTIGAWAAVFWALDINASAINRIGKEDTFLLFFLLLGSYLYERAKLIPASDPGRRARGFGGSGAAFGLMMASKYMPNYFGLHAIYRIAAGKHPDQQAPDNRIKFFTWLGGAFLAANCLLLLPGTWRYLAAYTAGDFQLHTGYVFAHRLYVNLPSMSPGGVPPSFYLTFFATKIPLFVLGVAALGLCWCGRHPRHRGAVFVRVFVVFTLLPYSFIASKFLRYMLPMLAVLDLAAAIGLVWLFRAIANLELGWRRHLAITAIAALAIIPLIAQQAASAPYYGLAQNSLGARLGPPGSMFPDDEFYDAGVREAIEQIAKAAPKGAVVCSDSKSVVTEYLNRFGRQDMISLSTSHDGLPMTPADVWIVVQAGHTYFESAETVAQLQRRLVPWTEIRAGGVTAAQVFRLDGPRR